MLKKLNYDEVYNRFKEKGLLLLDKEYISSATKMNCVDSYGYKYKIGNGSLMAYLIVTGKQIGRAHV